MTWIEKIEAAKLRRNDTAGECMAMIQALAAERDELQAQVAVLRGALETLVKKYIRNKGTEYQFVTCVTPQGTPDFWENAINALSTTPSEAAERVQDLQQGDGRIVMYD